jgi:hypothetical protein
MPFTYGCKRVYPIHDPFAEHRCRVVFGKAFKENDMEILEGSTGVIVRHDMRGNVSIITDNGEFLEHVSYEYIDTVDAEMSEEDIKKLTPAEEKLLGSLISDFFKEGSDYKSILRSKVMHVLRIPFLRRAVSIDFHDTVKKFANRNVSEKNVDCDEMLWTVMLFFSMGVFGKLDNDLIDFGNQWPRDDLPTNTS